MRIQIDSEKQEITIDGTAMSFAVLHYFKEAFRLAPQACREAAAKLDTEGLPDGAADPALGHPGAPPGANHTVIPFRGGPTT